MKPANLNSGYRPAWLHQDAHERLKVAAEQQGIPMQRLLAIAVVVGLDAMKAHGQPRTR